MLFEAIWGPQMPLRPLEVTEAIWGFLRPFEAISGDIRLFETIWGYWLLRRFEDTIKIRIVSKVQKGIGQKILFWNSVQKGKEMAAHFFFCQVIFHWNWKGKEIVARPLSLSSRTHPTGLKWRFLVLYFVVTSCKIQFLGLYGFLLFGQPKKLFGKIFLKKFFFKTLFLLGGWMT